MAEQDKSMRDVASDLGDDVVEQVAEFAGANGGDIGSIAEDSTEETIESVEDDAVSEDQADNSSLNNSNASTGVDETGEKSKSPAWWQNVISYVCKFLSQIVGKDSDLGKALSHYGDAILDYEKPKVDTSTAFHGTHSEIYSNPDYVGNYSDMSVSIMNEMHIYGAYQAQMSDLATSGSTQEGLDGMYENGAKYPHADCVRIEDQAIASVGKDGLMSEEGLVTSRDQYMSYLRGAETYRESAYAEIELEYADDPDGAAKARGAVDSYTRGYLTEVFTSSGSLEEYGFSFDEDNMEEINSFNCMDLLTESSGVQASVEAQDSKQMFSYSYSDNATDAFSDLGASWARNGVFEAVDEMNDSEKASYFGRVSGQIGATVSDPSELLELGRSYSVMRSSALSELDAMEADGQDVIASRRGLSDFTTGSVYQLYDLCYSGGFTSSQMEELDSLDFGPDIISYSDYHSHRYALENGQEFSDEDAQSGWYRQMSDQENLASMYQAQYIAEASAESNYQFNGSGIEDVVAVYSQPEADAPSGGAVSGAVKKASEGVATERNIEGRYAELMEKFGHLLTGDHAGRQDDYQAGA